MSNYIRYNGQLYKAVKAADGEAVNGVKAVDGLFDPTPSKLLFVKIDNLRMFTAHMDSFLGDLNEMRLEVNNILRGAEYISKSDTPKKREFISAVKKLVADYEKNNNNVIKIINNIKIEYPKLAKKLEAEYKKLEAAQKQS